MTGYRDGNSTPEAEFRGQFGGFPFGGQFTLSQDKSSGQAGRILLRFDATNATIIPALIANIGKAVDFIPTARPEIIVVDAPVSDLTRHRFGRR